MKIKFLCEEHLMGVIPNPVSSLRAAPNYFKRIKPQSESHPGTGTVKRCVPFLDALSSGFIIPLWADMYLFAKNGDLSVEFPPNFPMPESLGSHPITQIPDHPMSKKPYGNIQLKFLNPWIIETDPGVSCLFTSPLNHMEGRFKLFDGVVDTDTYYNNINFPFIWTGGDGEFLIQKGTPLVQVIPFKRDVFDLEVSVADVGKRNKVTGVLGTKMKNAYREEFWHKKKNNTEQELDSELSDSATESEWKTQPSSGILEFVADDKGRGFGEGGF